MKNPIEIGLKIKIYLDGANIEDVIKIGKEDYISGFTSNPSLMSKSGITNYNDFIEKFTDLENDKPISFEVVSDTLEDMEIDARKINSFKGNIYIKIPITNSIGQTTLPLIKKLLDEKFKINVTAILTENQMIDLINILEKNDDVIISYFAGRVADTGRDPIIVIKKINELIKHKGLLKAKTLWASPREVLNIYQANDAGVDIITVTKDLIKKLELYQKNLNEYSLETVKMFLNDAIKNNLKIK
mgnify:CR=1 FL=1|jgi:transaldolase